MSREDVRVLVVDDEQPARRKLRRFLEADPQVTTIFEAPDGLAALDVIRDQAPDIIFLDVQMPGLEGFGVLEALGPDDLPQVVFVTAFDHYALKAFEVHAVDYLLKPFDRERFARALGRAKDALHGSLARQEERQLRRLLQQVREDRRRLPLEHLLVVTEGRTQLVRLDQVDWIGSERNYISIHLKDRSYRVKTPLAELEERLDPAKFIRVSRSTILQVDRIAELRPTGHGDMEIQLTTGKRLRLSRRYRDRLDGLVL
jgi:two-component system LytT family response regulator